jgi:hypothetical protein
VGCLTLMTVDNGPHVPGRGVDLSPTAVERSAGRGHRALPRGRGARLMDRLPTDPIALALASASAKIAARRA